MFNHNPATRRDFLKTASAATLAALAGSAPRLAAAAAKIDQAPAAKADTLIVLWMGGGMAHTETFDPKRYVEFKKGMKAHDVLSTFPSIPTVVDQIKFSQGLENVAKVMDRGLLIRTQQGANLGKILHSRHQFHWHTGYEPPVTVAAPHLGAWIARVRGPNNPAIPAFIDVNQPYEGNGEAEELKAFQTAGFLGSEFGPFRVPRPDQAVATVRPPAGMSVERFRRRQEAYQKLVLASPAVQQASDFQRESLLRSIDNTNRLLNSPAAKAFDLSLEPKEVYDRYNTGHFGRGCLLARRLTEAGARYIEVSTEYVPFLGWDTHDNGHTRAADMKRQIDAPIAQLVLDLEQRGLLNRTLIVLASEFSRDVLMEGKPEAKVEDQVSQPAVINELKYFGMHRHFTSAGCVLMFGGGAQRGLLYGRTAEERPCTAIENPVSITDLHATIYQLMGISPRYHLEIEQRPFYVTKDGKGQPIKALMA
ncbi:MAG: DUF1501 domain-containing protein [Planctomycetia bacterium]|nr:DUF1501 domain-containing protein [Planctomycetia bacterium]